MRSTEKTSGEFEDRFIKAFEKLNKPTTFYTPEEIFSLAENLYKKYPKINLLKNNLENPNFLPNYNEIINAFQETKENDLKIFV
ncbi:MAG TPA: hypothetical protein VJ103_01450 [Candidatus Paceibacterota bacterium]|nr:hypothetical protein [Candidatus Paceibacterota bacterium]